MFKPPDKDRILSFAGIFQAATVVQQLATQESHNENALLHSALSVLRIDADSVEAIYDDNALLGCQTVKGLGSGADQLIFYAIGMHRLAVKIPHLTHISEMIHSGLRETHQAIMPGGTFDENDLEKVEYLYTSLGELYLRTISTLKPRIIVQGNRKMDSPALVSRIRTALFAGIRSAVLWHQLGGRRWHLLFQSGAYRSEAARLCRL